MQYLASDTSLMTPTEEVFSRRGGVKLLLMEVEQLRGVLDKLQQPANTLAGPRGTQDVAVQASQSSRSKEVWAKDKKWTHRIPSPAVEAMAEVVSEASAPSRENGMISGAFHRDRAPMLARYVATCASTAEEVVADSEEARHSNPHLHRTSSITHTSVSGSSRRHGVSAGLARLKRRSLLDLMSEGAAGSWTNGAAPAQLSDRDIALIRTMAKASVSQRGSSQIIADHQSFSRIDRVSHSRSSATATSASEIGVRGRPLSTVVVTTRQQRPDSRDHPGRAGPPTGTVPLLPPAIVHTGRRSSGSRLDAVLASLPPL
jgi:hypothetical protein